MMGCVVSVSARNTPALPKVRAALEVSYSSTTVETPCGLRPDFFDYNISQAYWESFVELNLLGSAIVLLEEEKKIRAYKMNVLKDTASLSVMKPRCKEL